MSCKEQCRAADVSANTDAAIRGIQCCPERLRQLAASPGQKLFVLEAKLGPNQWRTVGDVYPHAELTSYFRDHDDAKRAKSDLKSMLLGPWRGRFSKKPIRIRELDHAGK